LIAGIVGLRTRALELDRLRLEKAIAERSEELEAALREVAELSLTDPLTQARNRRFLVASIGREVARAKRDQVSNKPAADRGILFLLVDLDFFKEVNDRFGHAAGDRVLIEASRRIAGVGRESDFLVRWGGEEFLLVVPDAGFERGPLMAQRILDTFRAAPFDLGDGSSLRQSCSIGWAPFPWVPDGSSGSPSPGWEAVVDLADRALYVAKREGRDRAVGVLPLQGSKPTEKALDLADGEAMRLVRSGAAVSSAELAQPAGASSSGASGP
jgi:diguanylate cyclase (GGDEF)-like protein